MPEKHPTNKSVAQLLRNIATAHMLKGANRFRTIAYEKAADAVEHLSRELYDIWQEGGLYRVNGIGSGIGSNLEEFFRTGGSRHFDDVLKGVPASVFVLMQAPGIGPKKAFQLVHTFLLVDPSSVVEDLLRIAKEGNIAPLEGFGEKSERDIISALETHKQRDRQTERMLLGKADKLYSEIATYLKTLSVVHEVVGMGSLRRGEATVGDIDIAVMARDKDAQTIIDHFVAYPAVRSVEGAGDRKASILITNNVRVDLRVQNKDTWGSMLQYFTGNKAHNIKLREYALKKEWSLNEYGVKRSTQSSLNEKKQKGREDRHQTFATEIALYSFLGLQYIPPELRQGKDEIEIATKKNIPNLITLDDIQGDLHTHSTYQLESSHDYGTCSYQELISAAKSKNYKYIGFSDHNPKMKLDPNQIITILKERKAYIDQKLSSMGMKYFIGLEVDILPDGNLALPKEASPYLDYIIISIHSSFSMSTHDMTKRILTAMQHPKVKIFGHPTARIIQKRESIDADWKEIFTFAKKYRIALEINGSPARLDLPDILVKQANDLGCLFSTNTDTHDLKHLSFMKYAVQVARRGWVTKKSVINTWAYSKLKAWIQK
ncbi:PHP domain-containing protein [Candidatus Woesebacteria bacterium]|nr:PHP domain-containing protein [Candidatus Woesebacteria bacterium]